MQPAERDSRKTPRAIMRRKTTIKLHIFGKKLGRLNLPPKRIRKAVLCEAPLSNSHPTKWWPGPCPGCKWCWYNQKGAPWWRGSYLCLWWDARIYRVLSKVRIDPPWHFTTQLNTVTWPYYCEKVFQKVIKFHIKFADRLCQWSGFWRARIGKLWYIYVKLAEVQLMALGGSPDGVVVR